MQNCSSRCLQGEVRSPFAISDVNLQSETGGFKDTYLDDLLAPVLKAVVESTGVNPAEVGDIVIGTVLAPRAQRANECHMTAFFARFLGGGRALGSLGCSALWGCARGDDDPWR